MKKIIRDGNINPIKRRFKCDKCKCVFDTDEYKTEPDYRNGEYYVSSCPSCSKNATWSEPWTWND